MKHRRIIASATALLMLGTAAASAQTRSMRERRPAPAAWTERAPQPSWQRSRGPDLYSRQGGSGTITATTPNQWGNLGGPGTGGGGGGGP